MSVYSGEIVEKHELLANIKRLQVSFPEQAPEFFNVLAERVIANGFTADRLDDAVNWVIDNFAYKKINISDIIRFDRMIKLYTYPEVAEMVTAGKAHFDDFEIREINGRAYRVRKTDVDKMR